MRYVLYAGSAVLAGLVMAGLILGLAKAVRADSIDTAARAHHRQEIANFRKAWMNDCLEHAPPFQCIYMWSGVKPEEFTQ